MSYLEGADGIDSDSNSVNGGNLNFGDGTGGNNSGIH